MDGKMMEKQIIIVTMLIGMIVLLGGCGVNSNTYSDRLYQAIVNGDKEQFDAILKEGGDVNKLRSEESNSKKGILGRILSNTDYENVYPLEIACQKSPEMAYALLEAGADVSVVDPYLDSTPLLYALSSNHPERFELAAELIKRGADVNHIDRNKRIAVNSAVHTLKRDSDETKQQSFELLKELLATTDMNEVITNSSSNPLREAAKYGNCDAIDYILEQGIIDINLETDGMTPLMIAVIGKNTDACRLLLEKGADSSIVSKEGKTAYNYAEESNNEELMDLLKNYSGCD